MQGRGAGRGRRGRQEEEQEEGPKGEAGGGAGRKSGVSCWERTVRTEAGYR